MSPRLSLAVAGASLSLWLLRVSTWGAVRLFSCWHRRWAFVRGLRDRARLPWTDGQMEDALAKAGAEKGEAR